MKRIALGIALLVAASAGAQRIGTAERIKQGFGAPASAQCTTQADVGKVYARNDSKNVYTCLPDGLGGYAWLDYSTAGGTGLTSLGGQVGATQTFATDTSGNDFAISSAGDVHTFSIPSASATARGLVTTGAQTFAGVKTFSAAPVITDFSSSQHNHTNAAGGGQITDAALSAAVTVPKGGTGLTSGTSGGVPYFSAPNTIASSAELTANLPVIGGGAGAAPAVGTRSGNTTAFVTTTGTQTSANIVTIDANGNHIAGLAPGADGTYPAALSGAWAVTTPGFEARTDADGTFAILTTDNMKQINVSNATANAGTIAQAGTAGFEATKLFCVKQTGAGAVTVTATTSTFDITGTTSFSFNLVGAIACIRSDGTNYEVTFRSPIAPVPITFGFILGADNGSALTTADDQATIFVNRTGRSLTITEVWIECDATDASTSFNIQNDDGTAANILSSDVTCNTTGQTGTLSATEKVIANGSRIDLLTVTASTAKRMTLWVSMQ